MTQGQGFHHHPENPKVTQAWMCVRKGEREKALELLAGYQDPEYQVRLIEGFIQLETNGKTKSRTKSF